MSFELTAKLFKVFPPKTGEGKNGPWVKQDFLVETQETYPKKIYFSAWGDKGDALKNLALGEILKITFFVESREFNEKWYSDLRVWKIEKQIFQDATVASENSNFSDKSEVASESFQATKDETDDLPF